MNNEHPRNWLYKRMIQELFIIFLIGWGILFFMEILKQGIVSNYLSLPHLGLGILFLGIWAFAVQEPAPTVEYNEKLSKKSFILLTVVSIILALIIAIITELTAVLTLLIILVTVLSLWAGTLAFKQH